MKRGELLLISEGEYSDYGNIGLFKALKDFEHAEVVAAFFAKYPAEHAGKYGFAIYRFVNFCCESGYIEELTFCEWHVGSYGEIDAAGDSADIYDIQRKNYPWRDNLK